MLPPEPISIVDPGYAIARVMMRASPAGGHVLGWCGTRSLDCRQSPLGPRHLRPATRRLLLQYDAVGYSPAHIIEEPIRCPPGPSGTAVTCWRSRRPPTSGISGAC